MSVIPRVSVTSMCPCVGQVVTLKITLARKKQKQLARKLRRPRRSCVRAEQQLVEQVRRGRHAAADDSDSDLEPPREERRAKRSRTAEPRTPPAGKRSRTGAEADSPHIRSVGRRVETVAVTRCKWKRCLDVFKTKNAIYNIIYLTGWLMHRFFLVRYALSCVLQMFNF